MRFKLLGKDLDSSCSPRKEQFRVVAAIKYTGRLWWKKEEIVYVVLSQSTWETYNGFDGDTWYGWGIVTDFPSRSQALTLMKTLYITGSN